MRTKFTAKSFTSFLGQKEIQKNKKIPTKVALPELYPHKTKVRIYPT
jgi:hypothetical protein